VAIIIMPLFIEITSAKKPQVVSNFLHCEVHKPVKQLKPLPHTYHSRRNWVWGCTHSAS